ncbi:MAG: hypothetical protein R3C11_08140 [Planctomycetaceae bacterium]
MILGIPDERLSYRFHEGKYSGEISVESKPALIVAQTASLVRLEKKELITRHEVLLDVSNAPIYSLIITLNHLQNNQLQFSLPQSNIRITAELLVKIRRRRRRLMEIKATPGGSVSANRWKENIYSTSKHALREVMTRACSTCPKFISIISIVNTVHYWWKPNRSNESAPPH